MAWRRLLGRLDHRSYERVQCDPCEGTGFELVNGKPHHRRGRPAPCQKCHGRGWHMVRRHSV